jgi:hypothetical protein
LQPQIGLPPVTCTEVDDGSDGLTIGNGIGLRKLKILGVGGSDGPVIDLVIREEQPESIKQALVEQPRRGDEAIVVRAVEIVRIGGAGKPVEPLEQIFGSAVGIEILREVDIVL